MIQCDAEVIFKPLHSLPSRCTKIFFKFHWSEGKMFGKIEKMFTTQPKNPLIFSEACWRRGFIFLAFGLTLSLIWCGQVEAKRRTPSPVKISDVVITPEPFLIGKSPVTFSMLVELPSYLNGANVLEVSALISSPTRRTMSFVTHRQALAPPESGNRPASVSIVLVWDGKDQYQQLVADGSYYYEIRAKLMEDEGYGPRTKVISHRVQGTLDVLAYAGEVLPPVPPEPELPDEMPDDVPVEASGDIPIEADSPGKEGDLPTEDVPVLEEGLKAADEPANGDAPIADESLSQDPREPVSENFPEALPEVPEGEKASAPTDPAEMRGSMPEPPTKSQPAPAILRKPTPPAY